MNRPMRRKDRLVTDFDELVSIVSRCAPLHLGLVNEEKAYVVPVDFGFTAENGQLSFYVHSAKEGRKIDLMKQNPMITFTLDHSFRIGLGRPDFWTNAFESVMGEAKVTFLEGDEAWESIQHLMDRYGQGKLPEKIRPMLAHMASYRIDVLSMTGKSNLTKEQRERWGALNTLQEAIGNPAVSLQTIKDKLADL